MPKKKKTRKQKELTDVRRKTEQERVTYTATFETKPQERQSQTSQKPSTVQPVHQTPSRTIMTADYRYLSHDLLKTLTLTAIIIIVQLALKFGANL